MLASWLASPSGVPFCAGHQLRPTDHVLAAVSIYTDIINIFMNILISMARADRD